MSKQSRKIKRQPPFYSLNMICKEDLGSQYKIQGCIVLQLMDQQHLCNFKSNLVIFHSIQLYCIKCKCQSPKFIVLYCILAALKELVEVNTYKNTLIFPRGVISIVPAKSIALWLAYTSVNHKKLRKNLLYIPVITTSCPRSPTSPNM